VLHINKNRVNQELYWYLSMIASSLSDYYVGLYTGHAMSYSIHNLHNLGPNQHRIYIDFVVKLAKATRQKLHPGEIIW